MLIMLLHVNGAVLVKVKILVVTVMQGLEGQKAVGEHGVDLVTPKEMVVEGASFLAFILMGCKLLHILPCTRRSKALMED
jgi:hypothetical protein